MSLVSTGPNGLEQGQTATSELSSRHFLSRGFAVAVRLLHTVRYLKIAEYPRLPTINLLQVLTKHANYMGQLRFFPKQYFRMVAFANFFLL